MKSLFTRWGLARQKHTQITVARGSKKNMANLFRASGIDYSKYSGKSTDNFERYFMVFLERINQADISKCDRHRAFSTLLISHARKCSFDILKRQKRTLK